jgi:hypothetical protein
MADEFSPPAGEIPAVPSGPPTGDDSPQVDNDFIMSTLFGQDAPEPPTKPAGDQGTGAKPDGGTDTGTAPQTPAPAAKGSEAAPPEEQPPVPGVQTSQQPQTEQKPSGGAPPKTPAPGTPPAAAEPAPAETRLTPEERLQLASINALREQNQQLLDALQRGGTQPSTQPQTGQQPQPSGGPAIEQVHLTVPDDLYQAVFAEDDNLSKRGLNVLVSSIATAAVNHTLQRVVPIVQQHLQQYDTSTRQQTTAQRQEEDYYSAFPAHRNPMFRTAIESEMQKMASEMPNVPWNEDFRNALGTRVNRTLQLLGINVGMVPGDKQQESGQTPPVQGFGAPANPQANGGKPPVPAAMLDSSNRGAAPAGAGDFIAATFS